MVRAMEFSSILLTTHVDAESSPVEDERILALAVEQAVEFGRCGVYPWTTEHHFRGAWQSSPLLAGGHDDDAFGIELVGEALGLALCVRQRWEAAFGEGAHREEGGPRRAAARPGILLRARASDRGRPPCRPVS
jgi:hypothetical protein